MSGLRDNGSVSSAERKQSHNKASFLDCEINLRHTVLKPFDEINGDVVIFVGKEISSHGIFIQLEANIENRLPTYGQRKGLQDSKTRGAGFFKSPVRQYLVLFGNQTSLNSDCVSAMNLSFSCDYVQKYTVKNEHHCLPIVKLMPGRYTYPFKLVMPGEILPAAFAENFGVLRYKLAVYTINTCCANFLCKTMENTSYIILNYNLTIYKKDHSCCQMMAEKVLDFKGYNNLSLLPNFNDYLAHVSGISSSLFSSKQSIRAVFNVRKKCFLPNEEIVFDLAINNPKMYMVKNVTACLFQKTMYKGDYDYRKTKTRLQLTSFKSNEMSNDALINCTGSLSVPKNCAPSYVPLYSMSPYWMYTVQHVVQYEVQIEGLPTLMGKMGIVIGTTRNTEEELKSKIQLSRSTLPSLLQGDSPSMPHRTRSNSIVSIASTTISDASTLPPGYSQLSSRASSLLSIETLPPHYEDLP